MSGAERRTAVEAAAGLEGGALSAESVDRDFLDRAGARAAVTAGVCLDPELALAQARAIDHAGRPGVLKGVPVGVKDVIDTYDMPTQHGSPIYRGNRPFADAACVALTRAAGGVILGKTVTTEFANRHPRETVHPLNPAYTPGGSSSGSAAAVADFQVPVGFGTQTGGSTIRPAAFCGVIGYKPTFGEFSRVGIKMQCHNLDTLGIICRSLDDLSLMRAALQVQPRRPVDRAAGAPRIGFCRTPSWDRATPDTQALLERTAARLSAAGAMVKDVAPVPASCLEHQHRVFAFEAALQLRLRIRSARRRIEVPPCATGCLKSGRELPLSQYGRGDRGRRGDPRAASPTVFAEFDVLLAPSGVGEAPEGLDSTGDARFNAIWTLAWTPCVTSLAPRVPAERGCRSASSSSARASATRPCSTPPPGSRPVLAELTFRRRARTKAGARAQPKQYRPSAAERLGAGVPRPSTRRPGPTGTRAFSSVTTAAPTISERRSRRNRCVAATGGPSKTSPRTVQCRP